MRMYAVRKNIGRKGLVLALFRKKDDAENYIRERMAENIPSSLLDLSVLTIENDCYIEPLKVKID